MDLLFAFIIVVAFAFFARAILNAKHVGWIRLLVAALLGSAIGAVVAGLVNTSEDGSLEWDDLREFAIDLTFLAIAALATMAAVVGMELVAAKGRRRRRRLPANPIHAIRYRFQLLVRGGRVTRIASRYGMGSIHGRNDEDDAADRARSLRMALEQMGGIYIKLGQLLATRPDLISPEAQAELGQLHSSTTPLAFDVIDRTLQEELGDWHAIFASIDPVPLGSASIAQVHAARLLDGTDVVVKVQRPGLEPLVDRDLAILDWVVARAERVSTRSRTFGARRLTQEFARSMHEELDFRNEARHVAEIADALRGYPQVRVPAVLPALVTRRVLVMERLNGEPLSDGGRIAREHADQLADELCRSQITAMMRGDRFHGDPHAGNVLALADGNLGLIDFGMTGRLDAFGQAFVTDLLVAMHLQDPGLLYEALLAGGSIDPGSDRDRIERALAAYLAQNIRGDMPSPEALVELMRVTADLGVSLPDQASTMLRAVVTLMGTLEQVEPGYPFVERVVEAAGSEARARMTPRSVPELLQREAAALAPLIKRAPRHLDRIAGQLERGELSVRASLFADPKDVSVLERLLNKVLLTAIGLGILGLAILLIRTPIGPTLIQHDFFLAQLLGWVGLFVGTALTLRALLDVLKRTDL